jgi:hypothetical protein
MKYKTLLLIFAVIVTSCENDSVSDLDPVNPIVIDPVATLHDLFWANSSVSTNQQLNIKVGDTVRWTWGSGTHNLRSTSGVESFDSGYISTAGYQFMHEFTLIGATQFVCDPHVASMFGTITVTE